MTSFAQRLRARQLPTEVVPLAGPSPSDPVEYLLLRALAPKAWELLVAAHPPTDEDRAAGRGWHVDTFRPELIAASVLTATHRAPDQPAPELEELLALVEVEPAQLRGVDLLDAAASGFLTIGQLLQLYDVALVLNDGSAVLDRAVADAGKGSPPIGTTPTA